MDSPHGKTGAMTSKVLKGLNVLVTGHTGFKGSWLILMLQSLGARVNGFSLSPEKNSIFSSIPYDGTLDSRFGDIRNFQEIYSYVKKVSPDFVFHLAAQPLVIESFKDPLTTFQTNVIGTANILESLKELKSISGVIVVTSDKVYMPNGMGLPYSESAQLGGSEPYSASKAAAEMVVNAWRTVIDNPDIKIITARAGNVIGGGDIAQNRLIPDVIRAFRNQTTLEIRNPTSIRPWQHVLEPIFGYIKAILQILDKKPVSNAYNFGPPKELNKTVEDVLTTTKKIWPDCPNWIVTNADILETKKLSIDSNLANTELDWRNILQFEESIRWTLDWELELQNKTAYYLTQYQINKYLERVL